VQMRQRHAAAIRAQIDSLRLNISTLDHEMEGRPLLLPIFIGAFRRKEKIYRVVINGQTGGITGTAPLSWIKIMLAVAGGLAIVFLLLLILSG
jgi:hypothetical protein